MGHTKNKQSLVKQVKDALDNRLAVGEKKHPDKSIKLADGRTLSSQKIYSWETYRTYLKHCNYFTNWCKDNYKCKTLTDCREHADEWLQSRIDAGLSAYTIKLEVSALGKLYGVSADELTAVKTPSRVRTEITRSRGDAVRDAHFSEERNRDLVSFCQSTGLRRSELERLRGSDLIRSQDGRLIIKVIGGKGGRNRVAPVVGDVETVRRLCDAAGDGLVWGKVHSAADIHSYRRDYCQRVYDLHKRPVEQLHGHDLYHCRGDRKGWVFDRAAMLAASRALGHNRECVIAEHYLQNP